MPPPVTRHLDGSISVDPAAFSQWLLDQRQAQIGAGHIPTPENVAFYEAIEAMKTSGKHEMVMILLLVQMLMGGAPLDQRKGFFAGLCSFPTSVALIQSFAQLHASPIIQGPSRLIH